MILFNITKSILLNRGMKRSGSVVGSFRRNGLKNPKKTKAFLAIRHGNMDEVKAILEKNHKGIKRLA